MRSGRNEINTLVVNGKHVHDLKMKHVHSSVSLQIDWKCKYFEITKKVPFKATIRKNSEERVASVQNLSPKPLDLG